MRDLLWLELKLLARNRGAMVLIGIFGALLVAAVASGIQREFARARVAESLLHQDAERLRKLRQELDGIEAKTVEPRRYSDPRQAGRVGRNLGVREAVLPPAPLGWAGAGVSDLRPWHFTVSTYHRSAFADEYELRSPLELRVGALDLAFVIGWVMPLVIIALGYDWLARDRDSGRIGLLFGGRGAVVRAAWGRLAALAAVPALTAVALAGAALATASAAQAMALAVLVLAYGVFWVALVFVFNLWLARAGTIAAALAFAWLVACAVAPALLDAGIRAVAPLPSRLERLTAERQALVESDRKHSALLAKYLHDHPEAAGSGEKIDVPDFLLRSTIQHREIDALTEPSRAAFETARARQQALLDRLKWISPAVVLSEAMAMLAGNDARRHAAFEDAVGDLHTRWSRHFLPLVIAKARFSAVDVEKLPRFEFSEPGRHDLGVWLAAFALLLAALATGVLGALRLRATFHSSITGR